MSDALAAPLAELVDAPDSKSGSERSAGSIPAGGTIQKLAVDLAYLFGCFRPTFANQTISWTFFSLVLFWYELMHRPASEVTAIGFLCVEGCPLFGGPAKNCHQFVVCRVVLGGYRSASFTEAMGRTLRHPRLIAPIAHLGTEAVR